MVGSPASAGLDASASVCNRGQASAQPAPGAFEQVHDRMHDVDGLLAPGRRQPGRGIGERDDFRVIRPAFGFLCGLA